MKFGVCDVQISMSRFQRLLSEPKGHFFLFGPRGTGKSTYLQQQFAGAYRVDLLRPEVRLRLEASPGQLRQDLLALPPGATVILDEVQRLPVLLDTVHELIESGHVARFALTGSSARKLRMGGTNLLAGRAIVRNMHPFLAVEMGESFHLDEALRLGMVPVVRDSADPESTLESYLGTYLEQEVRAEGLVRNAGTFSRVLRAVAFSQGQTVNTSNLAHECAADRRTVAQYMEILRDLLLVFDVDPFTSRARREIVAKSRLYWFDAGVFRAARARGPQDLDSEVDGLALEGLVAQHLRAWADYTGLIQGQRHTLNYWRTKEGLEVDFIVAGPFGLWAFEVKNSSRIAPQDLRGLAAFQSDYPMARCAVLYRGIQSDRIGSVPILPVDSFLAHLTPGQPVHPKF